jgi:hypothetical protein
MANEEQNIKVISKNNSGFPEYLDFEKLRTEGIEYLGRLSGKIWTDHNVHDPGITILEVLCYSLLDLGYRTNLPAIDIFTRNPAETGKDDNFFSPAQILACNPLTIIDYRKLLIDIDGVKNAWLSPATDQYDFCKTGTGTHEMSTGNRECEEFLNGLYHVYIEPEKNAATDFKTEADAKRYFDALIDKVKRTLMAHRNFCEDFVDVYLMCKLPMGVCADIELEEGRDPEKIYLSLTQRLRDFFSPSPQFYTLQQLLDKDKAIDEVFAGRPYDVNESHGFIDTEELMKLKLKKEIHLSDVYHVILETEGVRKVNNLGLRNCQEKPLKTNSDWKFKLPENHIPDFSMACSGFQFTRNGLAIEFDAKKYEGLLNINFTHNGKVLYQSPSAYLDKAIPKGVYHSDLDEYFLLQDDFPRVYGIAEGGLPEDASNHRKAQALQLRGYLLFFDQLLAGYLAQLKNIRSLFAMSSSGDPDLQRTYFLNELESLPELNQLLRFAIGAGELNGLGKAGSILIRVVSKAELQALISENQTKEVDPSLVPGYTFPSMARQKIAINGLKDDLFNRQFQHGFLNEGTSDIYYYINSSSDEFSLISNKSFKTVEAAELHLSSVVYVGTFDENYRSFIKDADHVSFDLELNIVSSKGYLQRVIEDQQLYSTRRNGFLDHLLSRFAERFTDFALFSFGKLNAQERSTATIKAKEAFLSNYDELSANRGKGYDYFKNKWNNDNVSGFEREAKFLSGIEDKQLHSLCNFVVEQYDEQYLVNVKIAGETFFALTEKFDSRAEAEDAAKGVFAALSDPDKLKTQYIAHEKAYAVQLQYDDRNVVPFVTKYKNSQEADAVKASFNRMFRGTAQEEDVFISNYKYGLHLVDYNGDVVKTHASSFASVVEAEAGIKALIPKINEAKNWQSDQKTKPGTGTLYFNKTNPEALKFVNVKSFKIDINNTIVGKPDQFTYDLLDNDNTFKFYPEREFGTAKDARQHCYFVISLAADESNYRISPKLGSFKISIVFNNEAEATCYSDFSTLEEATRMQAQIVALVRKREFTLKTEPVASGWRFNYRLGYDPGSDFHFSSSSEYSSPEEGLQAAKAFHQAIPSLKIQRNGERTFLAVQQKNNQTPAVDLVSRNMSTGAGVDTADSADTAAQQEESLVKALELQKDISGLKRNPKSPAYRTAVAVDESNGDGRYVYRLVDKDHVLAFYLDRYMDKEQASLGRRKLTRTLRRNLKYLQLCLGGDIVHEVSEGSSRSPLYRYQLKAHNYWYTSGALNGQEIVLFESWKTYDSGALALQAFEENYFSILELATDMNSYANQISLDEPSQTLSQVAAVNQTTLVFIPVATQKEIESHPGGMSLRETMVNLIKTYPIKRVEYGAEAFGQLFCEAVDRSVNDPCKTGKPVKQVYYFSTYSNPKDPGAWQSLKYYDSPEAAMKDFMFFIALLRFAGNLYVDCDLCDQEKGPFYRIYLREVLAESSARFMDEASAWGKDGVEKFICAVQSGKGFHNYQRREDCCYTFYLNCGEDLVVHPCVYDTAKKRNEVLNDIYRQFNALMEKQSYGLTTKEKTLLLLDEDGQPFALQRLDNEVSCDSLMDALDSIGAADSVYTEESGVLFLKDAAGKVILQSYSKDYSLAQWKTTLNAFVYFFPLLKRKDEKTGRNRFEIELKFPGISTCEEEEKVKDACGCEEQAQEPGAYTAWKSPCSYASCEEALRVLAEVRRLLRIFENYQGVSDCECNSFGIALHFNLQERRPGTQTHEETGTHEKVLAYEQVSALYSITGDRIAFNPQCYESAQMACSAIDRTKRLSNAEGLHVAEHILLRPRCYGDCECRQNSWCGEEKRHCGYKWLAGDDDPCAEEKDICFIPGNDPYSFIATVVLPAWPERFRTASGRMLMEDMLYRLAPAHVMLRILWLAPHDFCCFESKYKNWHLWLAGKKGCKMDFSVCDFLDLLFRRNYECLKDCDTCLPCGNGNPEPGSCFKETKVEKDPNAFLNQINRAFCWRTQQCEEYEFIACEREEKVSTAPVPKSLASAADQRVFRASRVDAYRTRTGHIAEKLKKNKLVVAVQAFLQEKAPEIAHFEAIVVDIIQNKKPSGKEAQALNKHQVLHLLEDVTGYTLDHLFFKKGKTGGLELLNPAFEKMRKAKIDVAAIFNHWDGLELKKYLPDLHIDEIRTVFTGTNKK